MRTGNNTEPHIQLEKHAGKPQCFHPSRLAVLGKLEDT